MRVKHILPTVSRHTGLLLTLVLKSDSQNGRVCLPNAPPMYWVHRDLQWARFFHLAQVSRSYARIGLMILVVFVDTATTAGPPNGGGDPVKRQSSSSA